MEDFINDTELGGMVNIFQFAGTDTSKNSSILTLCNMAENPAMVEELLGIIKQCFDSQGIATSETLDENPEMELWIREVLRRFNPAARIVPRIVIKDFKIKDISVRQGDAIMIACGAMNFKSNIYDDPYTFNKNRFSKDSKKKIDRYQYMPFMLGKRNCIGKNLGELMVKLIVSKFVQHYELEKPSDVTYYENNMLLNSIENPIMNLRLRRAS